MSESPSDERGVGARLRSARERRRMTILQAAERMHVDPHVLEALEADDFAALGAPVYLKGHLRHYAELVGESPEALQALMAAAAPPLAPPDLTRAPKAAMGNPAASRLAGLAVFAVVLFALAGSVWWVMSLTHPGAGPAPRALPQFAPATPPLARHAPVRAAPPARAPAQPMAVSQTLPPGPASASPAPPGEMRIALKFSAPTWVEVYDAGGRRLLYGMVTAPSARTLDGHGPLRVLLGDASSVTLQVNGRPASFARFVRANHTARFLIAADGRAMPAPARADGG